MQTVVGTIEDVVDYSKTFHQEQVDLARALMDGGVDVLLASVATSVYVDLADGLPKDKKRFIAGEVDDFYSSFEGLPVKAVIIRGPDNTRTNEEIEAMRLTRRLMGADVDQRYAVVAYDNYLTLTNNRPFVDRVEIGAKIFDFYARLGKHQQQVPAVAYLAGEKMA